MLNFFDTKFWCVRFCVQNILNFLSFEVVIGYHYVVIFHVSVKGDVNVYLVFSVYIAILTIVQATE
jgi:hypothetical protein